MKYRPVPGATLTLLTLLCLPVTLRAIDLLETQTSSFTLSNGMTWIVAERPGSGGVHSVTYADAGTVRELPGRTGLNQLIRFLHLQALKSAGWAAATVEANMDRHCVVNTMPAADLERWLQSEARRIAKPDFTAFEEARKALVDERVRRRSGPFWLFEEFRSVSFLTHPYRQPAFGHERDIELLTRGDVETFYAANFSPANTIVSIAGEISAKEVRRMAEKYFRPLHAGAKPEVLRSVEPPQRTERRILVPPSSQGALMFGFHKAGVADPSSALWGVLTPILDNRMRADLVEKEHLASGLLVALGYPAMKYPGQFFILLFPAPGADLAALEARVLEHLERVKRERVSAEEIAAVKNRPEEPGSNEIAIHLADWQSMTGDWHNAWRHAEQIQTVTAAQLLELAQRTFVASNRTVAVMPLVRNAGATSPR